MAAATSYQREFAMTLLRALGLPTDVIGTSHARVLQAAGLQARHDQRVEDYLTTLTRPQISALINALQLAKGKR